MINRYGPRLVGRGRELRVLTEALARAAVGETELCLLRGEAGIGKTRLAEELRDHATGAGASILWGSCTEPELSMPYLPFAEAIGGYLAEAPPAKTDRRLRDLRRQLCSLFPTGGELRRSGTPVLNPLQLFEMVVALLELVQPRPCLLVIEDLHWADASTLRLLNYTSRRLRRSSLMLLGTTRKDGRSARKALNAFFLTWRSSGARILDLQHLSPAQVGEMARDILAASTLSQDAAERLYALSDGIPLLVEEILQEGIDAAQSEGNVIEARLRNLSDFDRRVIAAAAVLGEPLMSGEVAALTRRPVDRVEPALRSLAERHFLTWDERAGRYRFQHALIKEAIHKSLSAAERARLHATAADALGDGSPPLERMHHLISAGRAQEAVPACLQAAEQAERMGAYGDAAGLQEMALAHVRVPIERGRLLCRLGNALWLNGDAVAAELKIQEGVQLLEAASERLEAARGRLLLGDVRWDSGRLDEVQAEYERACEAFELGGTHQDLARAYVKLANVYNSWYRAGQAESYAAQAASLAQAAGAEGSRLEAMICRGWSLSHLGRMDEAREQLDEAYRAGRRLDLGLQAASALHGSIMVRIAEFRLAEARSLVDELKAFAAGAWLRHYIPAVEGLLMLAMGQPAMARVHLQQALIEAIESGATSWARWVETNLALVHSDLGNLEEAIVALPTAWSDEPQHRRYDALASMRVTLEARDVEAALGFARRLRDEPQWPIGISRQLGDLAVEIFLAGGQHEEAARLVEATAHSPQAVGKPYQDRMEGRLALSQGRHREAIERLAGSAAFWQAAGAAQEESRTRRALAEAQMAAGDQPGAVRELKKILLSGRARGAKGEEQRAFEALSRLGYFQKAAPAMVRYALEAIRESRSLAGSPLLQLGRLDADGHSPEEALRTLLRLCAQELMAVPGSREAEAGSLVLEYYFGPAKHERVLQRLHLTRSTFFRRLRLGWRLLAERLGPLESAG